MNPSRALFIYLSRARWARKLATEAPVFRSMARRFVAGETLEQAIQATRELNRQGLWVTLAHLGEHVAHRQGAIQATEAILEMAEALDRHGLGASISLKLSHLGIHIDRQLCQENLRRVLAQAQERGLFVRVDMEESELVAPTLALFRAMRREGFDNVGVVLQAYLRRTAGDVTALAEEGARIRLVKGAYLEPAHVAFQDKEEVDAQFDGLAEQLIRAAVQAGAPPVSPDGRLPPLVALATHDDRRIAHGREAARRHGLPNAALEFQLLYGIRRELQQSLAQAGHPTRIYVPWGSDWYPYFMRRLAERPANAWFLLSHLWRR